MGCVKARLCLSRRQYDRVNIGRCVHQGYEKLERDNDDQDREK